MVPSLPIAALKAVRSRCGAAEDAGSIRKMRTVLPCVMETSTLPPAAAMETRFSSEAFDALIGGRFHCPFWFPLARP